MTTTLPTLLTAPEHPISRPEPLAVLDEERQRKALGNVAWAGGGFVTVTAVIFVILAGRVSWAALYSVGLDVALLMAVLLRARYLRAAAILTVVAIAAVVPIIMVESGGLNAPVVATLPMIPLLVGSFAGARGASWMSALLLLGAFGVWVATRLDLAPPSPLPADAANVMRIVVALGSVGVATFIVRATERERRRLEADLDGQSRALYEISVHDPLTQLYNRRYLSHRLDEEIAFALRHGTGLGVVILDVDHFKRVNDEHGHAGGDAVLTALGAVLHNAVRKEDVVARYGGEEFAIVLRGLDLASVAVAAERVRSAVEAHAFLVAGQRVPVTVSGGCASLACCGEAKAVGHLLAVADARLYRAKQSGRNRVAFTD